MMVETMTSGGGDYRWDAATGALDLGRDQATATLADDTLVIAGKQFDHSVGPEIIGYDTVHERPIVAPATVCRVTFRPITTH